MNETIKSRFLYMVLIILLVGTGVTLIITALNKNINLYLTPTELAQKSPNELYRMIKVGGLVAKDSVIYKKNGDVEFIITDTKSKTKVKYNGLLPGLFQEGKGVIVEGQWQSNYLQASLVLAKHDENYTPPKVKQ
ncbi:MAG: cytochrome c maturation protein CcmE [Gammaproteobacteria bacterium]|nr:cytochrome c maturation protein CcmE [Gammaproteobacteria bacterium]